MVGFGLFSVFYFFIFCVLEKQTHPHKHTSTKGIIITLTNNNKPINIFFQEINNKFLVSHNLFFIIIIIIGSYLLSIFFLYLCAPQLAWFSGVTFFTLFNWIKFVLLYLHDILLPILYVLRIVNWFWNFVSL